ncbi:hypothetical protein M758_UG174000 [Ceratodon purpureus]|nr:hypothetical protein M758_UG174000 [Ceratodon purpureus]
MRGSGSGCSVPYSPAEHGTSELRAKGFSREGLHPSQRNMVESPEAQLAAFTERLKHIRPKQTVLEAEAEAAKGKNKNV